MVDFIHFLNKSYMVRTEQKVCPLSRLLKYRITVHNINQDVVATNSIHEYWADSEEKANRIHNDIVKNPGKYINLIST